MTTARPGRPLRWGAAALVALLALGVFASSAPAHARVSPAVSLAGQLQLYTLAVPTEKQGVTTNKIVFNVPTGFSIDSFAPSPGWQRSVKATGAGQEAAVQRVTWAGGRVPTGEDAVFSFLGQAAQPGTVRFTVEQTYSDGSLVEWTGSESSAAPAPTIQAVASLTGGGGSGGTSVVTIAAIVLAALALVGSGLALAGSGGGGRPLA